MINPFTIFPIDKQAHALGGAFLGLFVTLAANPIAGIVAVVLAGFGKELVCDQWLGWGNPDKMDIVATCVGGAVGIGSSYLIPIIKAFVPA